MSEEEKYYHFMFCYNWKANGESGTGYQVLHNKDKHLKNSDIKEAKGFIQDSIAKDCSHNKESIRVIFTNIILLNHCSVSDYWNAS